MAHFVHTSPDDSEGTPMVPEKASVVVATSVRTATAAPMNRGIVTGVVHPDYGRGRQSRWMTDLFQCGMHWGSCCDGFWCAPCQQASQYNRLTYNKPGIDWPSCCLVWWTDFCIAGGVAGAVYTFVLRQRVRQRYNLAGDDLSDCCVAMCCRPCSACQNFREMSLRDAADTPVGCLATQPIPRVYVSGPPR